MTFGILTVIVLAGLAGPLFSSSERVLVPVVVGELVAGLVVGKSGFGWVDPGDATTAFMAAIGFAMLMFAAGMHVPMRQPELARQLGRGTVAAGIAAVARRRRRARSDAGGRRSARRRSTPSSLRAARRRCSSRRSTRRGCSSARRARRRRAGRDRRRRGDRARCRSCSSRAATTNAPCSAPSRFGVRRSPYLVAAGRCAALRGSAGSGGSRRSATGRSTSGSPCSCSSPSAGWRRGSARAS